MPDQLEPETILREISELEGRIGELREAAGMPAADTRATLDAALEELEFALTALRAVGNGQGGAGGGAAAAESERRVLRAVFSDAPVPMFVLDRDTSVRRVNKQAAALLGTSSGYVSGKQFTAFCDLPSRAALRSQLASVVRTGKRRRVPVRFLGRERPIDAVVTLTRVWIPGEPDPMVIAVAGPTTTPTDDAGDRAERAAPVDDEAVAALVHRMDVLATASELLLDEPVFNETVAVRRCARLLAAELADWALIDITVPEPGAPGAAARTLRRQVVMGAAEDERTHEAARVLETLDPAAGTLPHTVYTTRQSALRPNVEDLKLLGTCPDGRPVLSLIGATSVLCVPIEDGDRCIGAITLAGSGEHGPFDLRDLSVVQRLGRYLALVIRASRLYRRRAEVADTLQASLLPKSLPQIPGVDLAARYLAATHGAEVGGDFYDVFPTPGGWGLVLGDVCGKGEDAAAVTSTARHGVRLVSRWKDAPADVLAMVNESLLDQDRFVTAVMAALAVREDGVTVRLGIAGHPPAIVIRADGVIRTASRGGVPLGLFEDFEAGLDSIELGPGDTLFLHSDGVLEACDLTRQEFGQERLLEALAGNAGGPVQGMLDAVERVLLEFSDGDLRDDVSMLALRVRPPSLN
ncbi:SpoIIE family protein phosphatase [Actinomadura parmotrematis]|uniref:SpoIIE family protein phosphatase n=1 Tax=Actinomadura parmotrematis TaxID=2864039 RepID=A0ABS7FZD6_9ACTN|nr:SpoIIE family protein phosphatase [Actinomadura parmotrematis]MBW8485811.1 SpoIIE family protein phosphatase [Actinomadura parmotrematis]